MNNAESHLLAENQSLKAAFSNRGLDLSQVFHPTPEDLARENRALRHLLTWVQKYTECHGDRAQMENEGYHFPPIEPDISPDNDWYRFELWIQGRPLRKTLRAQLPSDYTPPDANQLTEHEIISALETLSKHLANIRIMVDFQEAIPARLAYEELLQILDEEFDIIAEGFCHLGCTGYCPGCFQRPWCEIGCQSCWTEDEKAGEMFLIAPVKTYVMASPVSLSLLKQSQTEHDHEF